MYTTIIIILLLLINNVTDILCRNSLIYPPKYSTFKLETDGRVCSKVENTLLCRNPYIYFNVVYGCKIYIYTNIFSSRRFGGDIIIR